jgi:hypothetical protein
VAFLPGVVSKALSTRTVRWFIDGDSRRKVAAGSGQVMSNQADDDSEIEDWSRPQNDARRSNRMGQMIQRALIPGAEAQKTMARTLEKNSRVMMWSVVVAAISTVISAAGFVFVAVTLLRSAPH